MSDEALWNEFLQSFADDSSVSAALRRCNWWIDTWDEGVSGQEALPAGCELILQDASYDDGKVLVRAKDGLLVAACAVGVASIRLDSHVPPGIHVWGWDPPDAEFVEVVGATLVSEADALFEQWLIAHHVSSEELDPNDIRIDTGRGEGGGGFRRYMLRRPAFMRVVGGSNQ